MPITYEAMQPFAANVSAEAGRTQQRNIDAPLVQRQREAMMQFAGQRAALDARGYAEDAERMQAGIANRDRNAIAGEQFMASQQPSNRDVFLAGAERQQQADRFRLQAELNETELSQQEKMRLARLNNALGEVMADPTYTEEERLEQIAHIKGIKSPLEMRLAKTKVEQEMNFKNQQLEELAAKTQARQQSLKVMSAQAKDRISVHVDPQFAAEEAERIRAEIEAAVGPEAAAAIPPEEIERMIEQRAIKAGKAQTFVLQPDGKLEPASGGGSGKAGAAGEEAKKKEADQKAYRDAYDKAEDTALKKQQQKGPDDEFLYPQTAQWVDMQIAASLKARGFKPNFDEQFPAEPAEGKAGHGGQPKPAGSGEAKPFDVSQPQKSTPGQFTQVLRISDVVEAAIKAPGLDDKARTELMKKARRVSELFAKHSDESGKIAAGTPPEVQKEFDRLYNELDAAAKPKAGTVVTSVTSDRGFSQYGKGLDSDASLLAQRAASVPGNVGKRLGGVLRSKTAKTVAGSVTPVLNERVLDYLRK